MKSLYRRVSYSEFEVILRNTSNNGGSKEDAIAYLNDYESKIVEKLEIVEFSISKKDFSSLSAKYLEEDTKEAGDFFQLHSRLYGEGQPHNFDYIAAPTGRFGTAHYFNKNIFDKLIFNQ